MLASSKIGGRKFRPPICPRKLRRQSRWAFGGEILTDTVMPDPDSTETESSLELNFFVGKLKHTVRKVKKNPNSCNS